MTFEILNVTSVLDIFTHTNGYTEGLFSIFFLVILFVAVLILSAALNFESGFMAASGITMVAAIIMVPMELVSQEYMVIPIILFLFSILTHGGKR